MADGVSDKDSEALKRLEARKATVEAELKRKQASIREKARKRHSRQLIAAGRMVETAGLIDADPAVLLGGLLELADTIEDKKAHQRLRLKGNRVLKKQDGGSST